MDVVGQETITYRPDALLRVPLIAIGASGAIVGVVVGLDPSAPAAERAIGWVVALLGVVLAVRALRARVVADVDGLLVRGWILTRRLPWSDVRRIEPWFDGRAQTIVVTRGDGRRWPIECMASIDPTRVDERAAALSELAGLPPTRFAVPSRIRTWHLVVVLLCGVAAVAARVLIAPAEDGPTRDLPDFDADAGDCVSVVLAAPPLVAVVDCGPDAIRLLAVVDLDTSSPYPGEAALQRQANELCPPDTGRVLVPTVASWAEDDGAVYCLERP